MGIEKKEIITKKCDRCNKVFEGDFSFFECAEQYFMDLVSRIQIRISWYGPYQTSNGILCKECTIKGLEETLEQLKKE